MPGLVSTSLNTGTLYSSQLVVGTGIGDGLKTDRLNLNDCSNQQNDKKDQSMNFEFVHKMFWVIYDSSLKLRLPFVKQLFQNKNYCIASPLAVQTHQTNTSTTVKNSMFTGIASYLG